MGVIIRNHDNNHNMLIYNCIYSNILPINSFVFISYGYWRYPRITGFPQHNENNNVNDCFDFINMLMAGDWHYIVIRRAYMAKEPTNHYDSSVLSDY